MYFAEPFGGLIPGARGAVLAALLRTGAELTGRQVHGLVRDDFSLWSVQQALSALTELGVVETRAIGRAMVHTINENHYTVQPLRTLLDPVGALRGVVRSVVDSRVVSVILYGSVARGEARSDSDVDLAVIAAPDWDGRVELEDAVRIGIGNDCDVVVFTPDQFDRLVASQDEPVVGQILSDGVPLVGSLPPVNVGVP
ncbi:MAG: nucleotidyltransferase domain-containing protein [Micropruina sp.]|nr:nucleotidyltransferase domain-containing protein [Micropruina sp.]